MAPWLRWSAGIGGLTLVAGLAGWGTSAMIREVVAPPQGLVALSVEEEVAEEDLRAEEPARTKSEYIQAILARNIFDHTAIGQDPRREEEDGEVHTDLDLVLLGTIVATPEEYSSALIMRDKRNAPSWGYGLGDRVMGAELVRIERNKVWLLREDGRVEVLVQGGQPEGETRSRARGSSDADDAAAGGSLG